MENEYMSKEYLMIEAEYNIHNLKLAFKENNNLEEILGAITQVQRIKMDLLHTPSACGVDGQRAMLDGLEELKLSTLEQINNEPDTLIY